MSGKGGGFLAAAAGLMFAPVIAPALFGAGAAATGAMAATAGAAAGAAPAIGTTAGAMALSGAAAGSYGIALPTALSSVLPASAFSAAAPLVAAPAVGAATGGGLGGILGGLFNPSNPLLGQVVGGIGSSMMKQAEYDHLAGMQDDAQEHDLQEQATRTASYDVTMPNMRGQQPQRRGVPNPNGQSVMGLEPQQGQRRNLDMSGQDPAALKPAAAQETDQMMATKLPQMRPPRAGMAMTAGAQPSRPKVRYDPSTQRIVIG
jgi:hypothetical protein